MYLAKAVVLSFGIALSCAAQTDTPDTAPASQVKTIAAIGQDIADLKAKFPQFREFSVSKNVLSQRLIIEYNYHTHRSQILSGWRAQVPEPDDDGVWLYIDFHDPASTDQIHTLPSIGWPGWAPCSFEDKKVSFLMLEGDKTSPVSGEIWEILERHGVKPCPAPASQVKAIAAIGQDIANLKAKFPQLREFSVSNDVASEQLIIEYNYHTHPGYTDSRGCCATVSQVPQPDDDGVWLHIEFQPGPTDPTEGWPSWRPYCFEDKGVAFLIFEGKKTSHASDEIWEILKRHGVKPCTAPASQVKTIAAIGQDIANLKAKFPQLREFSVSKNVLSERLIIEYDYHTRWGATIEPPPRGSVQLPEPDDDGVWFYIDFHDPDFGSHFDTQPSDPQDCFEDKKVQFLIVQGKKTNPVAHEIWNILERHRVKPCAYRTPR